MQSWILCQVTGHKGCHSPVTLTNRQSSSLAPVNVSQEVSLPLWEAAHPPLSSFPKSSALRSPFGPQANLSLGPGLKPGGVSPPTSQKQPHPFFARVAALRWSLRPSAGLRIRSWLQCRETWGWGQAVVCVLGEPEEVTWRWQRAVLVLCGNTGARAHTRAHIHGHTHTHTSTFCSAA